MKRMLAIDMQERSRHEANATGKEYVWLAA